MVDVIRERYGKNRVETIADNERILWFNEKHIEEGLDYKHLQTTTGKYFVDHRKDVYH